MGLPVEILDYEQQSFLDPGLDCGRIGLERGRVSGLRLGAC